jgi:hypothetical protein
MRHRPHKRNRGAKIAPHRLPLPPLDPNAWYDAKFLAERWRVHPVTVWKWVAKGILAPPKKLGPNTSRFSGAAILARERD